MKLTYTLPDNLDTEIDELEDMIGRFKKSEVSPTEMKVHRVPFGVYEQRKKDTYMVRIRCGGAIVRPDQLEKIAELSKQYAADWIHVTSRQEIQMHYVDLDNIVPVIRGLKTVGLSPRGGGGNTVRNIMAQEDAGIAQDEVFDVSPYAVALTTRMIEEPDSWNLPRKFKIAFSGSSDDRGYATIHDVGFIAKMKDGKKGFKVYVGGGMGAKTELSRLFLDFAPEDQVYAITKAVKTVFYKHGNRRNKHAARLRFLWKTLGEEEVFRLINEEYDAVKKENPPPLAIEDIDNVAANLDLPVEAVADTKDYETWQMRFVRQQKQKDTFTVILPLHLGHMSNDQAVKLAQFLKPFGENVIRMAKDQNFLLRNIPGKYLPNVYTFLKATMDNFNRPYIIDKMLACAGASTCQLGICLSPNATMATRRVLEGADLALDAAQDIKINVSGCPNSCGQHHAADLGFFGKVARKGDKVYPAYNVVAGAIIRDGESKFAEKVGDVPARDLPNLVRDFIGVYVSKKSDYKSHEDYIQTQGKEDLKAICAKYKNVPDFDTDKNYYFDWGEEKPFSVAERGKGECSAGMFDLLEMDLGNIQITRKCIEELTDKDSIQQKQQLLKDVVFYSARTLLLTRGIEPKSEQEMYDGFKEHFIQTGLVDASCGDLLKIAASGNYEDLLSKENEVHALGDRIKFLYDHMNNAFEFKIPGQEEKPAAAPQAPAAANAEKSSSKVVKDFRGVACPMNFVKTKMELAKINSKELLEIWLDDGAPIDNVPGSVREEGHNIVEQKKVDDYWSVVIEKQ